MTARLSVVAVLAAVWVALWEDVTPANVVSGLLVALAVTALFPNRPDPGSSARIRPVAAARLLGYFLWKLAEANAAVAWEVLTPTNRVNEGIVAIPVRGVSGGITTIVANAISLTPGTLTIDVDVDVDPCVLYIHVLHLRDAEEVRREVLHLEALVIRAFGPADAVARLGGRGERADLTPSQATEASREEPTP